VVGAVAGAVAFGAGEMRRGVVRGDVDLLEDDDAPVESVPFGSTISRSESSALLVAASVLGTVIAIGALDDAGSTLPLEPLLRSASAIPPPSSAATSTTPIQTPAPMPPGDWLRGGGIDGIRAACAGACGAIAAEGNIERSMPAFCDHGLAAAPGVAAAAPGLATASDRDDCVASAISAVAGGGGGRIPPGGMSIFTVCMFRGSSCWTFMSGEIRTFDMSIVFVRWCRFGISTGATYARFSRSPCEATTPVRTLSGALFDGSFAPSAPPPVGLLGF